MTAKKQLRQKSIILLSGGLDSTVSAAIAVIKTKPLFALTANYGQRAAKMEILASRNICKELKIKHKIVELPFFREFKKCHLITNYSRKNVDPRLVESGKLPIARQKISSKDFLQLGDVWVPNRNALLINVAACFAEYYGAEIIVTGFNREEAGEFPDNTPQFTSAINRSLALSALKKVRVVSYVAHYTKKEIYKIGLKYKAPLQFVYSCYLGGKRMCGKCASCLRLKRILKG